MKILKIFGIVVGIHLFALILIFANPGCSSTTKPPPAPADTVARNDAAPSISVPVSPTITAPSDATTITPAPINFNPDAPAMAAAGGSPGIRFTPTRPNTPAASTLVTEPVADVTPATTYAVKSGDSLWSIAKRNHLTVAELAAANNLKSNSTLHEGQKLIIPGKPASPTAAVAASATPPAAKVAEAAAPHPPTDALKHVVKPGETLGSIARKYDVKQADIAVANNITDPRKIRPGMELVIPGFKEPGSRNGKTKAGDANAKSSATKSNPNKAPDIPQIIPPDNSAPKPPANDVPVIKIDEAPAPITPAPAPKG